MYFSHVKTIEHLIQTYQHQQPLHLFLKSFFRSQKKYGARDRKIITSYIYNYYRLANALKDLPFDEILNVLVSISDQEIYEPDEIIAAIKKLYPSFDLKKVFPFTDELSEDIDAEFFCKSMMIRPKIFIRIQNEHENEVKEEFQNMSLKFQILSSNVFSFESETKLTETKSFKKGFFVIQDLSSQQTANYFDADPGERWWDCCAGSGGKSLLFKDKFPGIHLTVSDVRQSILKNAEERFKKAGIKNFELKSIDMLPPINEMHQTTNLHDGIIVDAPCSGSGTWARTPEEILFFTKDRIEEFQKRQMSIVTHAYKSLKPGGKLIYITCSVFKMENEDVTRYLLKNSSMALKNSSVIKGYGHHADTMYVAEFTRSE